MYCAALFNDMNKFLLITHGHMASGMKSSMDILLGNTESLTVFDAYLNEEKVSDHVEAFYASCEEEDLKVLLSDVYGGSVCQEMTKYADRRNTVVVTGINLGFLMCLLLAGDLDTANIDGYIAEAKEGMKRIELENLAEADEDFF